MALRAGNHLYRSVGPSIDLRQPRTMLQNRERRRCVRGYREFRLELLVTLLLCVTFRTSVVAAMEATWTPNPNDDGGPLPLSQAQRQQLLQLEQTIVQSPDPQGTLNKVAQANDMDPQELVDMLQRNRRDMEAAGGGAGRVVNSWPQKILKVLGAMGALMTQSYKRNPKLFSILAATALLLLYTVATAPRTGFVISSGRSLWSKGHTTVWSPPQSYVDRYIDSSRFESKLVSLPKGTKGALSLEDLPHFLDTDGVEFHKLNRKSALAQATTAQQTVRVDTFLSEEQDDLVEKEEGGEDPSLREAVIDTIYDAAATVLSTRRLTEFVDRKSVVLQSSTRERKRLGMLTVKRMGDWGRFGLQPLKVTEQHEGESTSSLVYSTLKGGHFDGQIRIDVSQRNDDAVSIRVRVVVPKKGRKLHRKTALLIASTLAQSIEKSVLTQTKQTLARQTQGMRYRGSVHSRAKQRRHLRFENEKKHEEMAEDRRRKWQRRNPDAGRYRPSGDRMRSPNFVT